MSVSDGSSKTSPNDDRPRAIFQSTSINRPTKSSESRSVQSSSSLHSTPTHSRQPSLRMTDRQLKLPQSQGTPVIMQRELRTRTHVTGDMSGKDHVLSIDKSTQLGDPAGPPKLNKETLYTSKKSASSNSLSAQISPRRAGLGARTISPVDLQRSKRNSRVIDDNPDSLRPTISKVSGTPRKASGIPSPVKASLPRTRPSPIPPIPPIPHSINNRPLRRPSPYKPRDTLRSVSGPTISSRQRSVTLSSTKDPHKVISKMPESQESFTSPMKQPRTQQRARLPSGQQQLQPLNLPPLKVHGLGTPTARRVDRLSTKFRGLNHGTDDAVDDQEGRPLPDKSCKTNNYRASPVQHDISKTPTGPTDARKVSLESSSVESHKTQTQSVSVTGTTPNSSNESKSADSGGFFNRLSLSRSASRAKSKKKSMEQRNSLQEKEILDQQITPERSRRLSISWIKGKMSPFGATISSPRFDTGIPPTIPKSYTADSISNLLHTPEIKALPREETNIISPRKLRSDAVTGSGLQRTSETGTDPASTFTLADEEMHMLVINRKGSAYLSRLKAQAEALQARAVPQGPVDAAQCLLLGGAPLNLYEKGEIIDYDEKVYFTGQKGLNKTGGRLEAGNDTNFGYDDDRGDYLVIPGDHFAYRYEIVDVLGKGSFGQVLRCIDYKTGGLVAIKIIRNKKRFHAQALVEVNILQRLRSWDPLDKHHLIKYTDHFYFRHHLCIATDLLGMNLYEYIKSNDFKGCTLNVIRSFTTQLLECLQLLKKERVIHCDLKPENILLVNVWESRIKVIDFGSSCFEDQKVYTYIQSRFYRSPEVILGMSYGLPIDMWSMGCILAELCTGYPIFPGEDEQEQLACIMEVFGPPEKHLIENSTRKKLFFDALGKPRTVTSSKGRKRKPSSKTLSQALKCTDEAFLDFLTRCLRWSPQARMTPEEAQNHPFITGRSLRVADTPRAKKFVTNQYTNLPARPLPQVPRTPGQLVGPRGYSAYRSASTNVTSGTPHLGSPSKTHRRVVSNLPVPRERVIT